MKKCMFVLFVLNLVIVNGLSGNAPAAAAAAAGQGARAQGVVAAYGPQMPNRVLNSLEYGEPEWVLEWLNENPLNKNAVSDPSGDTLLMLSVKFVDQNMVQVFDRLVKMKPNALIKNNVGEDAFDYLFSLKYASNIQLKQKVGHAIITLMLEQGANIEELLQRAHIRKAKALRHKLISLEDGAISSGDESPALMVIDLLERERELKAAREALIPQGLLVSDIGKIIAPSDPRLLAIKHAIQDGDTKKLAEALQDNTLLEIKDDTGYTPFLYAAYINKPDMMRYLIQQGANTKATTKDNIGATYFGDYQKLIDEELNARRLRLEKEEYDRKAERERIKKMAQINTTALFKEMQDNPQQIWLGRFPLEYNMPNDKGLTLLMVAASLGINQVVEHILKGSRDKEFEAEPDLALQDTNGNTALHWAIVSGHFNIANLLVEKMDQKSIAAKNKNGFTAYDLAIKYADKYKDNADFQKLIDVLKKHGYPKN